MRIKYIGAVLVLASGTALAQTQMPSQQPAPQTVPQTAPQPQPAETPSNAAPAEMTPATPVPEAAVEHPKLRTVSACQKAIQASEKALEKSQASPDTIAQAWQHISNAKQEKGAACKDEAKQAQEML